MQEAAEDQEYEMPIFFTAEVQDSLDV